MLKTLAAAFALLMVFACGSTPGATVQGPTAASVAMQTGDLPSGMKKCDVSGDIDSYLNSIKTKDPSAYATTKAEWDAAKKSGATAGEVVFFADTTANCKALASNSSGVSSATYKLVVNFVLQFKDAATAAKGYTNQSIMGFSQASLTTAGTAAVVGTKTGLGPNSVTLTVPISSQSFYIAVWQNKAFMSILAILNIDSAASQKAALSENARIH
ncbi:MAG TPA: hypothetical protein VGU71_16615 [Candidatus Dormibacteraeota bacterium]|nr:hypothetical protein [Candidatus Dormibacteraeota bacterium]